MVKVLFSCIDIVSFGFELDALKCELTFAAPGTKCVDDYVAFRHCAALM